jgi:hypothetical protein
MLAPHHQSASRAGRGFRIRGYGTLRCLRGRPGWGSARREFDEGLSEGPYTICPAWLPSVVSPLAFGIWHLSKTGSRTIVMNPSLFLVPVVNPRKKREAPEVRPRGPDIWRATISFFERDAASLIHIVKVKVNPALFLPVCLAQNDWVACTSEPTEMP